MIGVTQMAFGIFGLLATIGLLVATFIGAYASIGYLYSLVLLVGVALPCLVIGNYVDDLRRQAVIAQIVYSILAVGLSSFLIYVRGFSYSWTVPFLDLSLQIAIGNVAAFIAITQTLIVLYLLVKWPEVAPPPGVKVERDISRARLIQAGLMPSPLEPALLAPDGATALTPEEEQRILDIRKVVTEEGMAVLCSNCSGATPLTKVKDNNTLHCDYCGVVLGVSSVFVPCENHEEYLAATTCNVCGDHFCRQCLTVQEPPVDERWQGSAVYLCKKCFEGRYRPAVTTASLVIPIDQLFSTAGSRFSKVGEMYSSFLGAYANGMKHLWRLPLELLASIGKSGGGGNDNCVGALLLIVIIIIAIPILAGVLMLLGAIIIVPILFYAGLIAVTVEAAKIISGTDFESVDNARVKSIHAHRKPKAKESKLRPSVRVWDDEFRRASIEHQRIKAKHMEERRLRERRRQRQRESATFWRTEYD
jgi:hypothetical protein